MPEGNTRAAGDLIKLLLKTARGVSGRHILSALEWDLVRVGPS